MQDLFRKKFFTEIGEDGALGREVQEAFEKAQSRAIAHNDKVVMTLKIIVMPPEPKDPNIGAVGYSIQVTDPAIKSRPYYTKLRDGVIVSTSDKVEGLSQLRLALFGDQVAGQDVRVDKTTGEVLQDGE